MARCTRCREILNHTIVAMVGEKVIRVECNTCRGTHNYHGEKIAKEPHAVKSVSQKVTAPRKDKKDPAAADRAEWLSLQATMDTGQAITYEMTGKYQINNLIMHHVFGLGVVRQVLPPNKIEVLFQDGRKLLRCG